jgi:hypothetical protein
VLLALVTRWVFRRFVPASRPAAPVAGWGDGSGG